MALALAILAGAWKGQAGAQPANPDLISARSQSGQFVVYASRSARLLSSVASVATNQDFVQLEPTLATVSCERIKDGLMRELGATVPWRGPIYLVLYAARAPRDTITITSQRFKGGWQYRVDFPDVVERARYVRVVVQVLLLELANRTAQGREPEIPLWLTEGFSELLMASSEAEIILPPPRATANRVTFNATLVNTHRGTLVEQAQKKLHGRPPLTFENLSWPTEEDWFGEPGELYCGSAQLFVGELLRLPEGRACLREMLAQLPQHYNWQFAFLRAFHAYFDRPLDVEKWWALSVAQATGRAQAPTWSLEASWQKLDQTIHSAVQVRTGANDLPLHAEVTLQRVIREWDAARQAQALNNTLRELGLLRLRVAQELVGLVQDYCQVIGTYLQQRSRAGSVLSSRAAGRKRAADAAVQQLDALDARREAFRPAPKPVPESQAPVPQAPAP